MGENHDHSEFLAHLARAAFGPETKVLARESFPPGDFTQTFRLELDRSPGQAIVKLFQAEERLAQCRFDLEADTLAYMKSLSTFPVPQVYYYHAAEAGWPTEALVLERIPGQAVTEVYDQVSGARRMELAENVAQTLLRLHAVRHSPGFGPLRGPFQPNWSDVFFPRLDRAYQRLDRSREIPEMVEAAEAAYALMGPLLRRSESEAVLLHGDLFWTNILVDPWSLEVTGLIDPIIDPFWPMPQWGDREYELATLLFMDMPLGLDLVRCYERHQALEEGFPLRRRFYNLWLILDIWRTIGYHNQQTDRRIAGAFLGELAHSSLV